MASEAILARKKEFVEKVSEKLNSSYAGVLVNYKGIDVVNDTKMRKEFREQGIEYFVVKNSILEHASKQAGIDFSGYLEGTTALALSKEDPVAAPKIISKYLKELSEETQFSVKVGFMDKKVIDADKVKELGSLPSREQLLTQLVGLIASPMRSIAIALNSLAKEMEQNDGKLPVVEKKVEEKPEGKEKVEEKPAKKEAEPEKTNENATNGEEVKPVKEAKVAGVKATDKVEKEDKVAKESKAKKVEVKEKVEDKTEVKKATKTATAVKKKAATSSKTDEGKASEKPKTATKKATKKDDTEKDKK